MTRRFLALASAATSLLLAAGCGAPGSAPGDDSNGASGAMSMEIADPVTPEDVAELGDITLDVWAEAGEEQTLEEFVPQFEERYPNVDVQVTTKSIDDLITTVVNAMASDDPPDVAQGNQGYAVDGALVEAELIRPLDDVAETYGWSETIGDNLLGPMRWDGDGKQFRQGTVYAGSPVANNVGVFYNSDVLSRAGVEVPTTFAELEDALAAVKQSGELPIMLGNAEKWPALHVYGALQGAYADPEEVNDWVSGVDGSTFETEGNRAAAETLARWEDEGYFGTAYNGIGADDAAARFGQGEGAFHIAGDWYAPAVVEGGQGDFGFMAPPPGESGEVASTGALSFPWHISSQTDALPAAVAFMAEMHDPDNSQLLVDVNRIPVSGGDTEVPDGMSADLVAANGELMEDDGQMDYLDWSTPTMYDTIGSALQELMADRADVGDFLGTVQQDWEAFQAGR